MSKHYEDIMTLIRGYAPDDRVEVFASDLYEMQDEIEGARKSALHEVSTWISSRLRTFSEIGNCGLSNEQFRVRQGEIQGYADVNGYIVNKLLPSVTDGDVELAGLEFDVALTAINAVYAEAAWNLSTENGFVYAEYIAARAAAVDACRRLREHQARRLEVLK